VYTLAQGFNLCVSIEHAKRTARLDPHEKRNVGVRSVVVRGPRIVGAGAAASAAPRPRTAAPTKSASPPRTFESYT
jgi:hypothetical protein